jgi:Flp pilus assembly protein TadB
VREAQTVGSWLATVVAVALVVAMIVKLTLAALALAFVLFCAWVFREWRRAKRDLGE